MAVSFATFNDMEELFKLNDFKVGYASVNINPPLNIGVVGYYVPRFAKGFLDDITASALAISKNGKKIIIISVDNCGLLPELVENISAEIEKTTGIPKSCIFLSATHTHTGPYSVDATNDEKMDATIRDYVKFLTNRICDLAALSLKTMKPARVGYATGRAPDRISYIRRYRMKDGTTQTCPPIDDPNIDRAIGELDRRVHVLRFDREGADSVVILNYGIHTDTIGGEYISSDFCDWIKTTLDKALDGTKCIFLPGVQGDVGSTNVHPLPGDMNDTEISFDNEMKSPGMARFVGRALAGTVLQVFDKVAYVDVDDIDIISETIKVAANLPTDDEIIRAKEYKALHDAGKDCEIPFEAMELTTVVAEAYRMCSLEFGPADFELKISAVKLGPIALVGIPGQPFTPAGVEIKDSAGWDIILPCTLTNGNAGYFPMMESYNEGGYEARTSKYKAGVAEAIVGCAKSILEKLKN